MKESYVENEFVELWIEEGIVVEVFKRGITNVNIEMAKAIVQDRLRLSNRIMRPILIDMGTVRGMDKAARDYFASEESMSYISVAAVLLNSYPAWIGGKLFLAFNKPTLRTELFKDRQKAKEWLKMFF